MGSSLAFPGHERSKHMGELKRGDEQWNVYLEMQPDPEISEGEKGGGGAIRGRIHFAARDRHRMTGWVFLEWRERDIQERFGEFSAVELWHFLEALED